MIFRKTIIILLTVLLSSAAHLIAQQKILLKPDDLKILVKYLASDEMRGRANGSAEMKVAAEWISGRFKEYGLKPLLPDGSFIQNYTYQTREGSINERNVVGFIEGSDPELKDQYIVLSAHFDHMGVRSTGAADSIYNGADDNAAGTCTLIGIAKIFHDSGIKPGRSIIFAAFSGEENGIRGSRFFVANSPVPVKDFYVDLNFEMIGHSEYLGKNKYYMTGTNLSDLDEVIAQYDKGTGFQLIDTIQVARRLFFASDNIAFSRISVKDGITSGIPSGTFATTTMAPYIHSPSDEAALFDFENMAGLVNHFSDIVIRLSGSRTGINWTDPKFVRLQ